MSLVIVYCPAGSTDTQMELVAGTRDEPALMQMRAKLTHEQTLDYLHKYISLAMQTHNDIVFVAENNMGPEAELVALFVASHFPTVKIHRESGRAGVQTTRAITDAAAAKKCSVAEVILALFLVK